MVNLAVVDIYYLDYPRKIYHFEPAIPQHLSRTLRKLRCRPHYYSTFTVLVPTNKMRECPPGNEIWSFHSTSPARAVAEAF